MKKYRALQICADILKLVGWIVIAVGVLMGLALFIGGSQTPSIHFNPSLYMFLALLLAGSVAIVGIVILAMGEFLSAVVDIAVHSQYLPWIQQNTLKTVEFFEHLTNKNNPQTSTPPPS